MEVIPMSDFAPVAALAFTVFTAANLLRFARGRDWNGVISILTVWGGAIVVLALFAQTAWADSVPLALTGGVPLSDLNFASLVVLGLQIGSTASAFNEARGAIDQSSSTAKPRLLDGRRNPV